MSRDDSFERLVEQLRARDDEAAADLFERYSQRLVALARRRLGAAIRQKEAPEDVVQSVYKSFFLRAADGQFQLQDWDGMWGLLVRITQRKCGHRIEKYLAARRDVRREQPPSPEESACWLEPLARDPAPDEAKALAETLEALFRQLPGQREREIVVLRLQQCGVAEIAEKVGRSERSVHRVLAEVRRLLHARLEAGQV